MSKQYLLPPHKRDRDGTASSRNFLKEKQLGGRSATIYPSPLSLLAISLLTFVLRPGYLSRREGAYHQICSSWGPARLSACRTSHYGGFLCAGGAHFIWNHRLYAVEGGQLPGCDCQHARVHARWI